MKNPEGGLFNFSVKPENVALLDVQLCLSTDVKSLKTGETQEEHNRIEGKDLK